ncbi:zinc finger protein GLIS3-like [Aricia agestis]|uniref:zinc finger protein GLIS3-like n=1 Tax=Aricia agestis TaxID=91739 RepID=UPI001C20651B|nr:zinc finger protein GLIS3-like [Aricia agestis]
MLVFPQWRSQTPAGCRVQRWVPAEIAPYLARPLPPPLPPQDDDDESTGGSSPDRMDDDNACGWRGCGARFPSVARLSAHVARVHAQAHSDGLFYCQWMGCARPQRGFNARYKMLVHVRTHTNERPHTCNQCHKSFSRAENLKIHLRSHSGEKPYVCPYEGCGKAYSNSSDRFKHTRTHTVDKPYCCKVPGCNKRYTDPSSLRKHVKTYKHFTSERDTQKESSDERQSPDSPREKLQNTSPIHLYSPVAKIPYSISTSVPYRYVPKLDAYNYEPYYPLRVPIREMSYVQYSQMYDHAYRSQYSSYPTEVDIPTDDVTMVEATKYEPEVPLNLICSKKDCKPIEELVRTDSPLDLSTKYYK